MALEGVSQLRKRVNDAIFQGIKAKRNINILENFTVLDINNKIESLNETAIALVDTIEFLTLALEETEARVTNVEKLNQFIEDLNGRVNELENKIQSLDNN